MDLRALDYDIIFYKSNPQKSKVEYEPGLYNMYKQRTLHQELHTRFMACYFVLIS